MLHPCGLIANTLFNDIFTVTSGHTMDETGIAWASDISDKVRTAWCARLWLSCMFGLAQGKMLEESQARSCVATDLARCCGTVSVIYERQYKVLFIAIVARGVAKAVGVRRVAPNHGGCDSFETFAASRRHDFLPSLRRGYPIPQVS